MTLIKLKWYSDACYCIFRVTIDDQNGDMDLVNVIQKCLVHDHMGDIGAYNSAIGRMKAWNNKPQQGGESHEEWFLRIQTDKLNDKKPTKPPQSN